MKKVSNKKKMSKFGKISLVMTSIITIWIAFPLALLLSIGLLPTFVAILTSKKNKTRITSAACFNLASLFPYIFDVIDSFTTQTALGIITNVFSLIFIYGVSAVGIISYQELPRFFTYFNKSSTKVKLRNIDTRLENLKEEWGEEEVLNKISSISI